MALGSLGWGGRALKVARELWPGQGFVSGINADGIKWISAPPRPSVSPLTCMDPDKLLR